MSRNVGNFVKPSYSSLGIIALQDYPAQRITHFRVELITGQHSILCSTSVLSWDVLRLAHPAGLPRRRQI